MKKKKIKVLILNGWGRSGSTILGAVLGEIDGFFYGGELRNIWNISLIRNRLCGCNVPFKECNLWNEIFNDAFGGIDKIDAKKITKVMQSTTRLRHIPLKFLPGSKTIFTSRLGTYLEAVRKLFNSIQNVTSCKVIVDSSKSPLYAYVLSLIEDLDIYVVHLIRDPRGVSYSKQKTKLQPNKGETIYMHKFNAFDSSLIWSIRNTAIESYWKKTPQKYLMVRYEDFIKEPKKTTTKILDFIGEKEVGSPFISERGIKLTSNHSVWGNPSRFKTGTIELKLDEEWKTKMKKRDKFVLTMLTFPWLLKYGYSTKG